MTDRAHRKIEARVEYPTGVGCYFWASIFGSQTCKWVLEASFSGSHWSCSKKFNDVLYKDRIIILFNFELKNKRS
jgi:hypothetical protein